MGPSETLAEQQRGTLLSDSLKTWLSLQPPPELDRLETEALESSFGSELERTIITEERSKNVPVFGGGRIRQEYVRRYSENQAVLDRKVMSAG